MLHMLPQLSCAVKRHNFNRKFAIKLVFIEKVL